MIKIMCQHSKLHPLIARRIKWIPETVYRDIEENIQNNPQKYFTSGGEHDLLNQKRISFVSKILLNHCV